MTTAEKLKMNSATRLCDFAALRKRDLFTQMRKVAKEILRFTLVVTLAIQFSGITFDLAFMIDLV
jgi:hypothetical protein